jgi:amidohydrolase
VKFIFQPAEEGYSRPPRVVDEHIGARVLIDAGVLENRRSMRSFGAPRRLAAGGRDRLPQRSALARPTPSRSRSGRQTHGDAPNGVDPIVASARSSSAVAIVSRQVNIAAQPAVLSIGSIHGGNRENIIPDSVDMLGTLRTYDDGMRDDIVSRMRATTESIARASGATSELGFGPTHYPTTVNDAALTARMLPTLSRVVRGNIREIPKVTASEDFSEYQKRVPGLFFMLGSTAPGVDPAAAPANHSPLFRVDESSLPVGVRALTALALDYR